MKTSASRYCRCLYFASNALARKVERLATRSWKKVDLSPSHGYLLMLVLDEPGIQPSALSEQLMLEASTITRLVDKLAQKELVARQTEGKASYVYPTTAAKALQPCLKECLREFYQGYVDILGAEASKAMVAQMCQMADQLDEK